ncbi:hypothetical protein [Nonomuraea helvata]|uniref:Polysaccharide chain length determinant N-terminal domain-containing protein n=1 Tax=Nonomuraea helvata TaxID=37484 RepID=A0ABV5SAP0_9ACTN
MEFWKAILGLARQKFIGIPVAVLTVALACAGYFALPERYVASVSMVLVAPSGGGSIDRTKPLAQTNPLLQFSDDLRTTASILILAMNTPDVFKSVGVTEDGPTQLTIDDGRSNPTLLGVGTTGPFVYVQVEGDSPGTATKVLGAAQERLKKELENRQNELKAHPITFVQLDDVVRLGPEPDMSAKLQGAVGGALLGPVIGFGAAYAVVRRKLTLSARLQGLAKAAPEPAEPQIASTPTATPVSASAEPQPEEKPAPQEDPDHVPEDVKATQNFRVASPSNGTGPGLGGLDETGPIDVVRANHN